MTERKKRERADIVIQNALTASSSILDEIPDEHRFTSSGIILEENESLSVGYYTSKMARQLTVSTGSQSKEVTLIDWMFNLTKSNMKSMYEECPGWGWDDDVKYKEMVDEEARFLVVSSSPSSACEDNQGSRDGRIVENPVAFVHLRYETEDHVPVVYVYEVQVSKEHRGLKLGWWLMKYVEALGRLFTFSLVMLTVFSSNSRARKFYSQLGYSIDPSSPEDDNGNQESNAYLILSKSIDTMK